MADMLRHSCKEGKNIQQELAEAMPVEPEDFLAGGD
jgi:hypothetical protein